MTDTNIRKSNENINQQSQQQLECLKDHRKMLLGKTTIGHEMNKKKTIGWKSTCVHQYATVGNEKQKNVKNRKWDASMCVITARDHFKR